MLGAAAEFALGRKLWGISGTPGLWSGDIWSANNSQFLLDPYILTHITHGVLFYAALKVVFSRVPAATRLVMAVGIETAWEVLENTSMVIERYRAETVSLHYYGDSVVNSMGDIVACVLGFTLAWKLPARVSVWGTIALELLLLVWIRDNLVLNIIMLIQPVDAIQQWQLGTRNLRSGSLLQHLLALKSAAARGLPQRFLHL